MGILHYSWGRKYGWFATFSCLRDNVYLASHFDDTSDIKHNLLEKDVADISIVYLAEHGVPYEFPVPPGHSKLCVS